MLSKMAYDEQFVTPLWTEKNGYDTYEEDLDEIRKDINLWTVYTDDYIKDFYKSKEYMRNKPFFDVLEYIKTIQLNLENNIETFINQAYSPSKYRDNLSLSYDTTTINNYFQYIEKNINDFTHFNTDRILNFDYRIKYMKYKIGNSELTSTEKKHFNELIKIDLQYMDKLILLLNDIFVYLDNIKTILYFHNLTNELNIYSSIKDLLDEQYEKYSEEYEILKSLYY